MNPSSSLPLSSPPWWRLPIMWLVLGGPAAVVIAGFATLWIAIDGADPIIANVPQAREVARSGVRARGEAPAQQVRNHAATPVPSPAATAPPKAQP